MFLIQKNIGVSLNIPDTPLVTHTNNHLDVIFTNRGVSFSQLVFVRYSIAVASIVLTDWRLGITSMVALITS